MVTSTVGVEFVLATTLGNFIIEGFPTPFLPKESGKPYYSSIKEVHQILMENVSAIESALGGRQNGYLGIVLAPEKCAHITATPFFLQARTRNNGNCSIMDATWVVTAHTQGIK